MFPVDLSEHQGVRRSVAAGTGEHIGEQRRDRHHPPALGRLRLFERDVAAEPDERLLDGDRVEQRNEVSPQRHPVIVVFSVRPRPVRMLVIRCAPILLLAAAVRDHVRSIRLDHEPAATVRARAATDRGRRLTGA